MAPAERADVIVDFTGFPVGTEIFLITSGPDEPFGGGVPGVDFPPADPGHDRPGDAVPRRAAATGDDPSTPPDQLTLPASPRSGRRPHTRQVSLNEEDSDGPGRRRAAWRRCSARVDDDGDPPLDWDDPITENPALGAIEVWEMHNFTEDAHPIHIHEVQFQVVDRQPFDGAAARPPGAVGDRLQGHGHRLPGRDHPGQGAVRSSRPLRLALPHRRARGQRDDAAVLHRTKSPSAVGKGHPLNEEGLTWGPLAWIALVPTCALGRLCQACRGRHGQDSRFEYRSPLFDMSA